MKLISPLSSFLLLCISVTNALPSNVCTDNLDAISDIAKAQLGPVMDELVCSKGLKPGKADWKWLEPHFQDVIKNLRECPQKPVLPNYKPKVQVLGDRIVQRCTKASHNYCNEEDLKAIKSCAVSEAMGWGIMNMDMLKYTDDKNCEKLVQCLKEPETWVFGKELIAQYAKYKELVVEKVPK
ncbi:hypothetical protein ABOM_008313 [Aspergillus bombycis]|uniref:Secreted protein n=1 Tax=Aspergillus bombycis TaxID=109264 RepID=A0A1F7ZT79_9EURO|nr:hypothetical protein ABOM_008313 [Aspergillus bombycis]OGM42479.1 hypothetical protein ABOM_008313 [Aspergillus bombycis]